MDSYITNDNWIVQRAIFPSFMLILPKFENIFGKEVMGSESCCVYADATSNTAPQILQNPKRIILKENRCRCAIIFELAHELTHYAIMQRTNNRYGNTCAVAAFEEPACEAMSLYVLKLCSEKQDTSMEVTCNCSLFPDEKNIHKNLANYRAKIYADVDAIDFCTTYEKWTNICDGFTGKLIYSNQRPDVRAMRNHLYNSFVQMPNEISNFIDYPLYLRSLPFDKLIDNNKWEVTRPQSRRFIRGICAIQPDVV